jgi:hypothetical protein
VENHKTIKGKEFKLLNIPYYLGTQLTRIIEKFVAEEEF